MRTWVSGFWAYRVEPVGRGRKARTYRRRILKGRPLVLADARVGTGIPILDQRRASVREADGILARYARKVGHGRGWREVTHAKNSY